MKGTVFMSRGRSADALLSYRRAHKLEPDAFTYEGNTWRRDSRYN